MIPLTPDALVQFLQEKKLTAQLDEKAKQIVSALTIGGHDYPMFVKYDIDSQVAQILLFMPFAMQSKSISDVARLLHLLNKEIDMPGFGMDEVHKAIFFRFTLAAKEGKIDSVLLERFLDAVPRLGYAFFPAIASVANGNASFETILKKMQRK